MVFLCSKAAPSHKADGQLSSHAFQQRLHGIPGLNAPGEVQMLNDLTLGHKTIGKAIGKLENLRKTYSGGAKGAEARVSDVAL